MVKIFVTGDNHFGKKYDRFPEAKERLLESRFEAFQQMVDKAEEENCALFVVTGDLFDHCNTVKAGDVKRVVRMLAAFPGAVLILPGNHDYYTGEEKLWKDFEQALLQTEHNITILKECREYEFDAGEEKIVVYPAPCGSKHSKDNNLGWIKETEVKRENCISLGVAHGAIQGVTPDKKEEYFLMTQKELTEIPVDAWLLGHTHISYPRQLEEMTDTYGYRIFNAGTHEQTDFHNHTEGNCFFLSIEKEGRESRVAVRRYVSGQIRFFDLEVTVTPDTETSLADTIEKTVEQLSSEAVLRLRISGSAKQVEYQERARIYQRVLDRFITYEIVDSELSEEITLEKIRTEFAQTSFAARLLEEVMDSPTELQMTYQLLQSCRESER